MAADEVRLGLCNANSFSGDLLRDMQFKIRFCFRTGVRQRNPHTLKPKLALVDTV